MCPDRQGGFRPVPSAGNPAPRTAGTHPSCHTGSTSSFAGYSRCRMPAQPPARPLREEESARLALDHQILGADTRHPRRPRCRPSRSASVVVPRLLQVNTSRWVLSLEDQPRIDGRPDLLLWIAPLFGPIAATVVGDADTSEVDFEIATSLGGDGNQLILSSKIHAACHPLLVVFRLEAYEPRRPGEGQ